ncbi:MAG: twin-arginine translocation signal domain-containing protein [Proteobacteria bacterium]|jgi:hypothetical protein|nr:twin-arginine translocation signal domain-containing protein [Pseudomonadota bacterium]
MLTRRQLLKASGVGIAATGLPFLSRAAAIVVPGLLAETDLIYLSPIKSNGKESRCQAEIWFAHSGSDMYVCTSSDAWRTRAIASGLTRARVWIGDVGNWQSANGKYLALPSIVATGEIISDKAIEAQALDLFGDKYPLQWVLWGPRFRKGLEDGSRTMIRYRPTT